MSRKIKQDYRRRKMKNPFFHKQKKGRVASKYTKYIFLLSLVFILVLIWFFLFSKFWVINNIEVDGLKRMPREKIIEIVNQQEEKNKFFIAKQNNIFLFNKKKVRKSLLDNVNFLEIKIQKKLPHLLKIIVTERSYAFIFQEKDKRYYVSKDGFVLQEIKKGEKGNYFIVENKKEEGLIKNNRLKIKNDELEFIFNLNEALKKQSFSIDKFIIDQEFYSIKVQLYDGPLILFSTKDDLNEQVRRLALVKKEKIRDNFNSIKRIDLRYKEKIYLLPQ